MSPWYSNRVWDNIVWYNISHDSAIACHNNRMYLRRKAEFSRNRSGGVICGPCNGHVSLYGSGVLPAAFIFPSYFMCIGYARDRNVRSYKRIAMSSFSNPYVGMAKSRKTYAVVLAAVFILGGLLGPLLHFASHAVAADHQDATTWHEGPLVTDVHAEAFACDLCDFHLVAAPVQEASAGTLLRLEAPRLQAPAPPHFSSVDLPLSRAPPAGA